MYVAEERGSVGLLYGRKCTIGFRKTHHFALIWRRTTSAWRKNTSHRDIIHTVKKKIALQIWCTYSEGIQCRLCGSGILKVIRELRDYCWRSFVFYTFVIAKNVVSLFTSATRFPEGFCYGNMEAFICASQLNIFPQVWYWNCYFYFHFILCQTCANSLA